MNEQRIVYLHYEYEFAVSKNGPLFYTHKNRIRLSEIIQNVLRMYDTYKICLCGIFWAKKLPIDFYQCKQPAIINSNDRKQNIL